MADDALTREGLAFKIFERIALAETKTTIGLDRTYTLDLLAEVLRVVDGERSATPPAAQGANR